MQRLMCLVLGFAVAALGMTAQAQDTGTYLKDGKLTARVEVLELQGGFAGFTGTFHAIEPDGSWTTGQVGPRDRRTESATGKLSADQLKTLAKAFAAHDLAKLPNHGQTQTNPKVVTVVFGKKKSSLQPKAAGKPDADKAIRARYAGIVEAVKAMTKSAKKE